MPLWLVELDGVGEFYVEARTAQSAVDATKRDLMEQLDVEVMRAEPHIEAEYEAAADPASRRALLASSWSRPWRYAINRSVERNRLALEKSLRQQEEHAAWVDSVHVRPHAAAMTFRRTSVTTGICWPGPFAWVGLFVCHMRVVSPRPHVTCVS
ncbi:MAG TPA: hypothetical protein VHC43_08015 [Mycobacteriales bacterium]|nr:hypothetical protein [Mycobacteriales bacterium]